MQKRAGAATSRALPMKTVLEVIQATTPYFTVTGPSSVTAGVAGRYTISVFNPERTRRFDGLPLAQLRQIHDRFPGA